MNQKYDRCEILLPKGAKADLQEYAKCNDLSLNALILNAIERQYHFNFDDYKKGAAE